MKKTVSAFLTETGGARGCSISVKNYLTKMAGVWASQAKILTKWDSASWNKIAVTLGSSSTRSLNCLN